MASCAAQSSKAPFDTIGEPARLPVGVRHDGAEPRAARKVAEPRTAGAWAWTLSADDNSENCGKRSDCEADRRRNELVFEGERIRVGQEVWIAFDLMLGEGWEWDRRHSASVAQIKYEGPDLSLPAAMVEWKAFGRRGLTTFFEEPVIWRQWRPPSGQWFRITIGLELSADPERGFFEMRVDDRVLMRRRGPTIPPSLASRGSNIWGELRLGVYKSHLDRDGGASSRQRAYFDNLRFAASEAGLAQAVDRLE